MSYILDALRKAESGHRSAPAPTAPIVSEPVPAAPADVRRRVLLVVAMAGIGVAVAAALFGWQYLRDEPAGPVAVNSSAAPATPSPPTRPLSGEVLDSSGAAPREPARALDREARRGQGRSPGPESMAPASASNAGAGGAPVATAADSARQPSATSTDTRRPRPGTVTVMGESQSVAATTAADAMLQAGQDSSVNGLSNVPLYTDLLLSGRLNLPNLRMDMHVFNADPTKRFVFINLRKYREGERIEDRATLDTITRDGAVLSHNGVRFRLLPD